MSKTAVFEAEATVSTWDNDYYTPVSEKLYDRAVADMLAAMAAPKGTTILDGGCGPGVHSIRVARAGYNVRAVDISETMLSHAKRRVQGAGLADRVTFETQDLTRLNIADQSIDYAFSWGVIIHIPDAETAFREMARIVRPGGKLALYLTNRDAIDHRLERLARKALRKPLVVHSAPLGDYSMYKMNGEELCVWQFDTRSIRKLFDSLGFREISRRAGEFSEIQRRVPKFVRNTLLHANNLAYAAQLSASLAVGNLAVFERLPV